VARHQRPVSDSGFRNHASADTSGPSPGYFERFIKTYPTVAELARASLAEVLSLWSGLGYNRRAQRLHTAAKAIRTKGWPDDSAGLANLPGVGTYTARAIACFAFGHSSVPVDTNIRLVLSRWHGDALSGKLLDTVANTDRDQEPTDSWTQAVMDLGARNCRPRAPACKTCSVAGWCTEPETYVAPRRQGRFEGSERQLRGAIICILVGGQATAPQLSDQTGFTPGPVKSAPNSLIDDELVVTRDGRYRLPN
jgi:A/G-specific adenine glycosylase